MEQDPFALVEAMTIAAYATGCERGYLYVRAEYPLAHARLESALAQARAAGLLGDGFDVELRIGAGAYVCGEETALFQSIEGYRGEPRNKPPFPVEVGLFGKPTVVNNVETLANVPAILNGETRETRLFCVSGDVARPGLYELELGTPLRELLDLAEAEPPRRCCSEAPQARSSAPGSSIFGSTSRPRSAPASSWCSGGAPTSRPPSCGSPSSFATSRAASACRAGSGPFARRRPCTASRPAGRTGTSSRCSTISRR